ncbi:YitT family protein [Bacillus sp. S/N-304-OC-R1]|uniref:YitT family protein n=1 Tax=Bacillus sp. S/N-304-OC-R1 TaxID=2758034 RepID=UPI001C8EE311|nr:YitT family protein [Bacillus sp. S/N-304-OC-R1]MBY0121663.1 YitT family protein [Bacillus sp. S/N-304-OC-R1]
MKRGLFIVLGCLITSIGVIILKHAGIMTGGTGGLSLILTYASGLPFGLVFFLVNIPFYILAVTLMGWNFTITTILSVTLLSVMTGIDNWLPTFSVPTLAGAILGGIILGFGLSIMFMNRTSLGGSNIVTLILQKKLNWNPGKINFILEFVVVLYGFYSIGFIKGILSVLSIILTSSIISMFKNKIEASYLAVKNKEINHSNKRTMMAS